MKYGYHFLHLILLQAFLLLLTPAASFAQTFVGTSSAPTDNFTQIGPTLTLAPVTGMQAGDLAVVFVQYRSSGGVTLSVANAGGQTWTSENQFNNSGLNTRIFWCRFNGTWSATLQFTAGGTNNQALTAVMYVYRPTNSGNRWTIDAPQVNTTSTSPHTSQAITGITTTMPRAVVMAFWNSNAANTWNTLTGAGWLKTGLPAQVRNTSTSGQVHSAAYRIQATPGATGNVTQTQSAGTPSARSILAFYEVPDECAGAIELTSSTGCTNTRGTVNWATNSGIAAPSCGGTADDDVWFRFTAVQPATSITLSSLGANLSSSGARLELFDGSCGSLISVGCTSGTTALNANTLVPGQQYFIRVYSAGNAPITTGGNFDICVQHSTPPANDNCSGAVNLTVGVTCANTSSNVQRASPSIGLPAPACGGNADDDVWFRFTPTVSSVAIALGIIGANLNTSGASMEVFSGACGSLTSIACGKTPLTVNGLTGGTEYFIRVYSDGSNSITTGGNFNICLTENRPANVSLGKSFINLSRPNGGTVTPGDVLEIRVSMHVTNASGAQNRLFRMRFNDTVPNGLTYIPNSMRLLTNESKPIASYTDAPGDDFGIYNASNRTLRINLGRDSILSPNNLPVGFVSSTTTDTIQGGGYYNASTHRPRAGGGTLVIITYRVSVDALPFNTVLNYGTGAVRYRTQLTSINSQDIVQAPNGLSFIIYPNYGLCANATGSNSIGAGNGDFGSGVNQNGPSPGPNVPGYGFLNIGTAAPNDGNYSVVKNLSPSQSTNMFIARPEASATNRVFSVWDIIGDHTGAADPLAGNPPSPSGQAGGYMLAVNAAYQLSVANNQTITGLCENTFYEFSAWFRNVCKRCGSDSAGFGASGVSVNAAYIPTAPGDSSGVKPNLTFMIDGVDYYNSGDMDYIGQWGQWVKKGFVFKTAPGQTSLTISIKNNAPGGGGNDWVMDDISFATCLPQLQFFPTIANELCQNSQVRVSSIVNTFFDNYRYYQWERSTDNGSTWHTAPLKPGIDSFTYIFNGASYIDTVFYPEFLASASNNGHQYRLRIATTIQNLNDGNCNIYQASEIVTVNVGTCDVLAAQMGSFSGVVRNNQANLRWQTLSERKNAWFEVERSIDGRNFTYAGKVYTTNGNSNVAQQYQFIDPVSLQGATYYRLKIVSEDGNFVYSNTILLNPQGGNFALHAVVNPVQSRLQFALQAPRSEMVTVQLVDLMGRKVKEEVLRVQAGSNPLQLQMPANLQSGNYLLLVRTSTGVLQQMIQKM